MLTVLGLGVASVGLAACGAGGSTSSSAASSSAATAASGEIPDETAGSYPGDGSNGPDVLERSGIVRSDIRASFVCEAVSATARYEVSVAHLSRVSLTGDNVFGDDGASQLATVTGDVPGGYTVRLAVGVDTGTTPTGGGLGGDGAPSGVPGGAPPGGDPGGTPPTGAPPAPPSD